MTHALKTWPEYYQLIKDGTKTFEVREFDRPFEVGDRVILQEYDPATKKYSGAEMTFEIGYIITGWGLKSGYCVMSLKEINY